MQMNTLDDVIQKINSFHGGDDKQMEIILSEQKRLIVEAPAGCGKTTTMVSKVAYLFAKGEIPINKKILALTFSVNAAYKMKKDIANKLPLYGIEDAHGPKDLDKRIQISNYHGLCRRIISLYGYLCDNRLVNINDFKAINECDYYANETFLEYGLNITDEEKKLFSTFNQAVLSCDESQISNLELQYISILQNKFFPKKCITFNGYLIIAKVILANNKELLKFYQKLYHTIIIDEFQDTNFLSWKLICMLISKETNLFFMGDSLQRIYGFIGAIPNLIDIAEKAFSMYKLEMTQNYRFKTNPEMLYLDRNIRSNAKNPLAPDIIKTAEIKLHYTYKHSQEADWIISKIKKIQSEDENSSTALLVNQRGNGVDSIIQKLDEANIDYFYALFSDEDLDYISFHKKALAIFYKEIEKSETGRINKSLFNRVYKQLKETYPETNQLIDSLLELVKVFFERICKEYLFLDNNEKISLVADTFENRALKQNMDMVRANLFISTVHGAKGLEWDYVFIPDMEPFCFPNYPSLCKECIDNMAKYEDSNCCKIDVHRITEKSFIEELSVFYVAVTRVKKELFFSASQERTNAKGIKCSSKISCLLFLPGISIRQI